MAYWAPKDGRYVFVYTYAGGRRKQVKPRSQYAHLDAFLADPAMHHNIDVWVAQWAAQHEKVAVTPAHILFSDDRLNRQIDDFEAYLKNREKLDSHAKYASLVRRYAVPFFLSRPTPLKDPNAWPGVSAQLLDYLESEGKNPPLIREINNALRRFWTWLCEEHLVANKTPLLLCAPVSEDGDEGETPLPHTVDPADVLKFVRNLTQPPAWGKRKDPPFDARAVKLMALLGYFFSLRPQEVFALTGADFIAGKAAAALAPCKAMADLKLFSRFAVNVQRQRTAKGKLKSPKAHSKGWVATFDREAAELLVELLNASEDLSAPLFALPNRQLYVHWAKATQGKSLAAIDLKDLRRASLYHLGHHTPFQGSPILLMKHARHKELETTMLYLRRPEEEAVRSPGKLDLGA